MIDFRVRPPYKSFLKMSLLNNPVWHRSAEEQSGHRSGRTPCQSLIAQSMELFMEEMDAAGVTMGVVMGRQCSGSSTSTANGDVTPDEIYELMNKYPGRFVGMGGFDVLSKNILKDIERSVKQLGMRGVSIEPIWCAEPMLADDPRLFDIYQLCAELDVPVSITLSFKMGPRLRSADPCQLEAVAQRFPDLKILVPHGGWPWFVESMGMMLRYQNIYMIPDVYLLPEFMPMREDFIRFTNVATPDQVLFASSYPVRSMGQAVELWQGMAWSPETLQKTLFDNAVRVLKLNQ